MSESELAEVKKTLRCMVVSSPTAVDVRSLLRDYSSSMGHELPYTRFGHTNPIRFLRDKCRDSFLLHGPEHNPTVTLIVRESLKHINDFVMKQRAPRSNRPKRSSVTPTYRARSSHNDAPRNQTAAPREQTAAPREQTAAPREQTAVPRSAPKAPDLSMKVTLPPGYNPYKWVKPRVEKEQEKVKHGASARNGHRLDGAASGWWQRPGHTPPSPADDVTARMSELALTPAAPAPQAGDSPLAAFMRRRLPPALHDDDANSTGASSSSAANSQLSGGAICALETLRDEVAVLVTGALRCEDVPAAYRAHHHRELDVQRFGYTGIAAFVLSLVKHRPQVRTRTAANGQLVLLPRDAHDSDDDTAPAAPRRHPTRARAPAWRAVQASASADEDALPGVEYDPEVFPADCVHYLQSIPGVGVQWALEGVQRRMAEVRVGEVYSPSHLWVQLLGEEYHIAMEEMMDEMTLYYSSGDGKARALCAGAVKVGHYCAAVYDNDWHRAVIVSVIAPSRTDPRADQRVKVRHVDYGTVDTVSASSLKPLLSKWAELPAQAVRARLGGVRPVAGARRWSPAASLAFLHFVRDKHFVASILSVDTQESIVQLLLVDTSTEVDVRVDEQLVRAGYAEPDDATMEAGACAVHLLPTFTALEDALTPNFAEIHAYLRDGISLDCVPEFRQHVPSLLPPPTHRAHTTTAPPARLHTPTPPTHARPVSASATNTEYSYSADTLPPSPSPAPPPPPPPAPSHETYSASLDSESPVPSPSPPPATTLSPLAAPFVNRIPLFPSRDPASDDSVRCPSPTTSYVSTSPTPPMAHSMWSSPAADAAAVWPRGVGVAMPPPEELCGSGRGWRFSTERGEVTLTLAECEVYRLLLRVDANAAHWYMVDAISRASHPPQPVQPPAHLLAPHRLQSPGLLPPPAQPAPLPLLPRYYGCPPPLRQPHLL